MKIIETKPKAKQFPFTPHQLRYRQTVRDVRATRRCYVNPNSYECIQLATMWLIRIASAATVAYQEFQPSYTSKIQSTVKSNTHEAYVSVQDLNSTQLIQP